MSIATRSSSTPGGARHELVLLHGWAMTPAVWDGLRDALGGIPVLTPSLPGHGSAAAAGAGLAAWADAVAASIPDGAVLGGWSLGALLALEIARRHPDKASRLLLFGATPRFVAAPDWPHGLAAETVAAFRAGFATAPEATLKRFLALQCLGDARRKVVQSRLAATLAPIAASSGLADGLALLADTDLRGELEALGCPCLLVHGAQDALMPPGAADWLARSLPRARLHCLPDAGHAVFLSQPEACAALIRSFLDD